MSHFFKKNKNSKLYLNIFLNVKINKAKQIPLQKLRENIDESISI